jgi:acyl carrier protein
LPDDGHARQAILARVRMLLHERLDLAADGAALAEDTGLLGQGIGLDSVEVLQLVSGIEEAWDLTIPDEDLRREHFATLGTVVTFIQERLPS